MADHAERLIAALRRRPIATWCVIGLAVVIALWALMHGRVPGSDGAGVERTLIVQPRPFASTISVVGVIVPGDSVPVIAPFDGAVRTVGFDYGRHVAEGQVLLAMDTFDIEQRTREAQTAYLKAAQAEGEMANWTIGPDVSRAQRAVTAAELDLKTTQRKAAETKELLDRGLVARIEYDGLVEQQQTQTLALDAAREDLATVLKRGAGSNRQASMIELQNAQARLADLEAQARGALVKAPTAGLIVRPPADKQDAAEQAIHAGQRLARGQLVAQLVQPGALGVSLKLAESDADQVSEGQAVTVSGPGFGGVALAGRISSVAGEASASSTGGAGASFATEARLEPMTPDQARHIRIGMSANVVITTYQTTSSIVVPPQAVQGEGAAATVSLRDPRTGRALARSVTIGAVTPDGVEIRAGLRPGEQVIWREPAPSGASAGQ